MFTPSFCAPNGDIVYCAPCADINAAIEYGVYRFGLAYSISHNIDVEIEYVVHRRGDIIVVNDAETGGTFVQVEPAPMRQISSYDPSTRTGRVIQLG